MKIPDEFMVSDGHRGGHGDYQHPPTVQQQPQQNPFRRGSLDNPKPVFKVRNVLFHTHTLQFHGYLDEKFQRKFIQIKFLS